MEWYYEKSGETIGPVSESTLRDLLGRGMISEETLLWRDGLDGWMPYASLLEPEPLQSVEPGPEADPAWPYQPPRSALAVNPEAADFTGRGIGALFRHTFAIMRSRFCLLMAVYLVIWLPLNAIIEYADYHILAEDDLAAYFRLQQFMDGWIGIIAVVAVLTVCISVWDGSPITFGEAIGKGFSSWGYMWVTRLLYGFAVVAGFICLILPGIYVAIRLMHVDNIVAAEGVCWTTAVKRSWELTQRKFWPLFGRFMLGILVVFGVAFPLGALLVVPQLDNWIASTALDCLVAVAEVFFIVYVYVIYQHATEDEAMSESIQRL